MRAMTDTPLFHFHDTLRVRFADTDPQGHVFFGNYYTYFDEALTQYMRTIGCPYQDLAKQGVLVIYTHSECDYHSRTFPEDRIKVFARIAKIGNSSITFEFVIRQDHSDELVANGKIVVVTIDHQTRKPVRVPDGLRDVVAKFESA